MINQNPSINHHMTPKAYLKGFSVDNNNIWRYTKNKEYCPGSDSSSNPYLIPLKQAGVVQKCYSYTRYDGSEDSDSVETELSKYENHANNILLNILRSSRKNSTRLCRNLNSHEKNIFAGYVDMMLRRTSHGLNKYAEMWLTPPGNNIFPYWRDLMLDWAQYATTEEYNLNYPFDKFLEEYSTYKQKKHCDNTELVILMTNRFRIKMKDIPAGTVGDYLMATERIKDGKIPKELQVKAILRNYYFAKVLRRMNWTFCIAPHGNIFITCDNPVVISGSRLKFTNTEITFPLSPNTALFASWNKTITDRYTIVSPAIVKEINRRTIENTDIWLYANYDSSALLHMLSLPKRSFYESIYDKLT